jgi:hypothetical protein
VHKRPIASGLTRKVCGRRSLPMSPLIFKRAPIGCNQDDYDVLEDGVIVGRIFKVPIAPQDQPWMRASGHNGEIRRAAHGYEATREAAMAAFAKSWRRQ